MIEDASQLEQFVERVLGESAVALDTEFVWERTFYPRLGLIQAAVESGECFLIDPVAIQDLSPLAAVLASDTVTKILHDARQDLIILAAAAGKAPRRIFDTQAAAGFASLSATVSLRDLVDETEGVKLAKGETRTNWLRRPLSDKQISYAENDVRYLFGVRDSLLERMGARRAWLDDEMQKFDQPTYYEAIDPRQVFRRIKGIGRLEAPQLAALQELACLREHTAQTRDRPRGHVATDDQLMALAKELPRSAKALRPGAGVWGKERSRYDQPILDAITEGLAREDRPEMHTRPRLNSKQEAQLDICLGYLKGHCLAEGIDPRIVCTRSELTDLIAANRQGDALSHPLLGGWRRAFIGENLLAILQGNKSLQLDPLTKLPRLA